MKRICVFCGSSDGARPEYALAASELGKALALRNIGLVYGGAGVGLMGQVATAALKHGGEVIGVLPDVLKSREIARRDLTELRIVPSMHARKKMMEELSDGFIAMPGGFGTLDEFCEIVTWFQLGIHQKPVGLLNTAGFFDSFLAFVDHSVSEGFIRREQRVRIQESKNSGELVEKLYASCKSSFADPD
jgi:uncharacterized protein (TIGR00730 family)